MNIEPLSSKTKLGRNLVLIAMLTACALLPSALAAEEFPELKGYYGSIARRAAKISQKRELFQSLPEDYLNALARNPALRKQLALELLTESLRQDFQPYPDQASEVLESFKLRFKGLGDIGLESRNTVLMTLRKNYQALNRTGSVHLLRQQLSFCTQNGLLLCQADMGYRLAQKDQFSAQERMAWLETAIGKAGQLDHQPLMIAMVALYENLKHIRQTGYYDRYLVNTYRAKARDQQLNEVNFTLGRLDSLEELHYYPVCEAHINLPHALKGWDNLRHQAWGNYGLAWYWLMSHKPDKALEFLSLSEAAQQSGLVELQAKSLLLRAEAMIQKQATVAEIKGYLEAALKISMVEQLDAVTGRAHLLLNRIGPELDSMARVRHLTQALAAYARAKDLPVLNQYEELLADVKLANLKPQLISFFETLAGSSIARNAQFALKELVSLDPSSAAHHAVRQMASESEWLRKDATEILTQYGDASIKQDLLALLKHPNPHARGNAIQPAWRHLGVEAIPFILPLLDDPAAPVRFIALKALSLSGQAIASQRLLQFLQDPEAKVRDLAAQILAKHPEGISLLKTRLLFDENFPADSLARLLPVLDRAALTDAEAGRLIHLLGSENRDLAYKARIALNLAYSPSREQALLALFERDMKDYGPTLYLIYDWKGANGLLLAKRLLESPQEESVINYIDMLEKSGLFPDHRELLVAAAHKWDYDSRVYWQAVGILLKSDLPEGWQLLEDAIRFDKFPRGNFIQYFVRQLPCHLPQVFLQLERYNQMANGASVKPGIYYDVIAWMQTSQPEMIREHEQCRPFSELQPVLKKTLLESMKQIIVGHEASLTRLKDAQTLVVSTKQEYQEASARLKASELKLTSDKSDENRAEFRLASENFFSLNRKLNQARDAVTVLEAESKATLKVSELAKKYLTLWKAELP